MRLSEYLDQLVADISAVLTGVSVAAHPGEFDLIEMQRYAVCPPLVRVWLARVLSVERGRMACQFGAAIVARRTSPTVSGEFNALSMTNALLLLLNRDQIASDAGSQPDAISAQNKFERYAALAGMHFWQVSWQQTLVGDDSDADLADFQTLFATYTTPAGDVTRAIDAVDIPQE